MDSPLKPSGHALGPDQRSQALARLRASVTEPLDVLVVGGGVVGCGSALDAAARGLSVALVEAGDLAAGTSSRSSRLAHGGLRYLEQREFALVHEALTERGLLLDRIAPHLVRPIPFIFPVTGGGIERSYVGAGVALYDMLSRIGAYGGAMPRPRNLSRTVVAALAPGLDTGAMRGAVRFHDAQIDDARHTVALARTAQQRGASVATRVRVVELIHEEPGQESGNQPAGASAHALGPELQAPDPEASAQRAYPQARWRWRGRTDQEREGRRVVGAVLLDTETGERISVRARVVLAAAGVWTDSLVAMATGGDSPGAVRRSKGVHLVVPRAAFRSSSAVIARTPNSVLFLLPWSRHWLIGTTDTDDQGAMESPSVGPDDVSYLLGQANRWLRRPLRASDVVGVYAGLRPLLSGGESATTQLSREHAVMSPVPGFVAIAGGKYTTYRVMAADAVDAAAEHLPGETPSSTTEQIPVVGGEGYAQLWADRVRVARSAGLPVGTVERLLRRHGDRVGDLLDLIAEDPALAEPLHPDGRVIRAEAIIAVRDEGARSIADILIRRTRLAVQTRDRGLAAAADTSALVAPFLGWDRSRIAAEVADLLAAQPAVPAIPEQLADFG